MDYPRSNMEMRRSQKTMMMMMMAEDEEEGWLGEDGESATPRLER